MGKKIANKFTKSDAKNISKSFIDSDEFKSKARLAWDKELSNVNAMLRKRELKAIENETRFVEEEFESKGPEVIDEYVGKAEKFVNTQIDTEVESITDEIEGDEAIFDNLFD